MSGASEDEGARDVLRKRAERLRARPVSDDGGTLAWLAELPVGPTTCVLPLASLRACVPLRAVTHVPLAPAHVLGIVRFRGQTITALSLASLLGVRGWSVDPGVLVVVEPSEGHLVALDCESAPRAMAVAQATLDAARASATRTSATRGGVELALGDRVVHWLDLETLVAPTPERRAHGA